MNAFQRILWTIQIIDEHVNDLGFRCIEAEWLAHTGTLRIYIDHVTPQETGINHVDCGTVTRVVDDIASIEEHYNGLKALEVSSPGVERPMRLAQDFLKEVGKEISVALVESVTGQMNGQGILKSVSAEGVLSLDVGGRLWSFPIEKVKKARTIYHWG